MHFETTRQGDAACFTSERFTIMRRVVAFVVRDELDTSALRQLNPHSCAFQPAALKSLFNSTGSRVVDTIPLRGRPPEQPVFEHEDNQNETSRYVATCMHALLALGNMLPSPKLATGSPEHTPLDSRGYVSAATSLAEPKDGAAVLVASVLRAAMPCLRCGAMRSDIAQNVCASCGLSHASCAGVVGISMCQPCTSGPWRFIAQLLQRSEGQEPAGQFGVDSKDTSWITWYARHTTLLLAAEELQMKHDLESYDMFNVQATVVPIQGQSWCANSSRFKLSLTVPGVVEQRPPILYGDPMRILPAGNENVELEGFVINVRETRVTVMFHIGCAEPGNNIYGKLGLEPGLSERSIRTRVHVRFGFASSCK